MCVAMLRVPVRHGSCRLVAALRDNDRVYRGVYQPCRSVDVVTNINA